MDNRESFEADLHNYCTLDKHREAVVELIKVYGTDLSLKSLLSLITSRMRRTATELFDPGSTMLPDKCDWKDQQKIILQTALDECGGNVTKAAKRVGLSRATMYRKIQQYQISTDTI